MIRLDGATFLLQWATGGLAFLWVTTRHRLVGLGYGWLLRGVFGALAVAAVVASRFTTSVPLREACSAATAVAAAAAFAVSVRRKAAGVRGQHVEADRKRSRVAAMAVARVGGVSVGGVSVGGVSVGGVSVGGDEIASAAMQMRDQFGRLTRPDDRAVGLGPEFPPFLDLIAPAIGLVGLVAAGWAAGGNHALAIARTVIGALFLGAVTDAMLLGHWYLVQPGLGRRPISELNDWLIWVWPVEVGLLLVPTGMISVLSGSINDHYNGMLGWFWVACALTTLVLAFVTRAALKERFYSAVMAATGLLYLAILTAFGTDLVARAILS